MSEAPESAPLDTPVDVPRRWIRPRWLIFSSIVLLLVAGPLVVRWYRVSQIPLIPEPFDLQEFAERYHISDSENAYVEYKEAVAKLDENPAWQGELQPQNITGFKWETSPNEVKEAVKANEAALELWMQGAQKVRAVSVPPDQLKIDTPLEVSQKIRSIARVAVWKQIQLQDEGRLEESWKIIDAGERTSVHLMQGATLIERLVGIGMHGMFTPSLSRWSEDPEVSVKQLRTALESLREHQQKVPPVSDNFKGDYFVYRNLTSEHRKAVSFRPDMGKAPRNLQARFVQFVQGPLTEFAFRMIGEYEFSERFMRQLYANWIKSADLPLHERETQELASALFLVFQQDDQTEDVLSAKRLSELGEQTIVGKSLIGATRQVFSACDRDRFRWSVEELILALQIYYRNHEEFPKDLNLLVPEVLEKLPENPYRDEIDAKFRYRVEKDHVVIWSGGEYEPVPLEEGPVYVAPSNSRGEPTVIYYTIYPPGTRAPLYRPYPPGFEEALKKKKEEEEKKSRQSGGLMLNGG